MEVEHIYAVVEFEVELGEGFKGPDVSDVQNESEAMSKVLQSILENPDLGYYFTRLDVDFKSREESDENE